MAPQCGQLNFEGPSRNIEWIAPEGRSHSSRQRSCCSSIGDLWSCWLWRGSVDRDPLRERGNEALDPSRLWLTMAGVAVGVGGCAVGRLRTRDDFEREG